MLISGEFDLDAEAGLGVEDEPSVSEKAGLEGAEVDEEESGFDFLGVRAERGLNLGEGGGLGVGAGLTAIGA